jgi:transcription elongation factor Elf1
MDFDIHCPKCNATIGVTSHSVDFKPSYYKVNSHGHPVCGNCGHNNINTSRFQQVIQLLLVGVVFFILAWFITNFPFK